MSICTSNAEKFSSVCAAQITILVVVDQNLYNLKYSPKQEQL